MDLSNFGEESATERNYTKILYAGSEDRIVELSPLDIVSSLSIIAVTLFFKTDIAGEIIKQALQKVSEEHYELFGRIIPHPTQCVQLRVDHEGWFPFVEQSCSLNVHEALAQYGQIQVIPSEDGKTTKAKLVFSSRVDAEQLKNGREPLFTCKLTHFVDGYCAVGFVFSHALADGQRFVDLLVDIGKAARGLEIEPKIHDRTLLWPDEFLKKIQVTDLHPTKFPRIASPDFASLDLSPLTSQTETLFSQLLHFSDELLYQLKTTLSKHLSRGEYLSTGDIVTAVMWLLLCEIDVADSNEKTLPERLKESIAFNYFEAYRNGASWVPSNYSANAVFNTSLKCQENENDLEKDSLLEMLLNAALTVRRGILGVRGHQAKLAERLSARYRLINDVTLFQYAISPFNVMFSSSWTKMGFKNIDFGTGEPCFIDCPCKIPLRPQVVIITPGLKSGGIFVSTYAGKSKHHSLFNSRVLKECAPEVNFVFGKDPTNPEFNLQL